MLHVGNVVLGHVALKAGKVNVAEAYLRKAGKTPGSPRMTSGGPDTTLAAALLERERLDPVLAYLQDCQRVWERGRTTGAIARWRGEIHDGKIPDFRVP